MRKEKSRTSWASHTEQSRLGTVEDGSDPWRGMEMQSETANRPLWKDRSASMPLRRHDLISDNGMSESDHLSVSYNMNARSEMLCAHFHRVIGNLQPR